MKKSEQVLFAKLKGFSVDIDRLRKQFVSISKKFDPVQYKDNDVSYFGWAVTSRDGGTQDGVRRISLKSGSEFDKKRGKEYTDICTGYLREVMDKLKEYDIDPYRARIMQIESEGSEMPLHTDASQETWRLHIPIDTNSDSLFEWERENNIIESIHIPADGSAYLVRVDVMHRAVNRTKDKKSRVHLLMGCNKNPSYEKIEEILYI